VQLRRAFAAASALALASLVASHAPAQTQPKTPVTVAVAGHGTIRLLVADGAHRPCDVSDNRVLYRGRAAAGDTIKLVSATGSVCVDHTYGAFRESQWAGASIWSGSGSGWTGARDLSGSVSTDEP
jgi:hypothetical protein